MRLRGCALVLLLLLASVQAQIAEPVRVAEDVVGDYAFWLTDQSAATGQSTVMDLVSLDVQESASDFRFTVGVGAMPAETLEPNGGNLAIYMTHVDVLYRLRIGVGLDGNTWANLYVFDSSQEQYTWVEYFQVEVDESAKTYSVVLDRQLLLDSRGAAPFPGRELTDMYVESQTFLSGSAIGTGDRMPDSGVGENLAIQFGIEQKGDLLLGSEDPFRASNGEATTYVFQVNLTNSGESHAVGFSAKGVPSGWAVSFPDSQLEIGPGESLLFPVIVRTPFAHQHGAAESFIVEASTSDKAHVGRVELGARYLAVPQPAGHHNEVFFHTSNFGSMVPVFPGSNALTQTQVFMNTLEDFDGDEKIPASAPGSRSNLDGKAHYNWYVWLSNGLQMGLDFDLSKVGDISIPFQSVVPMLDAQLEGRLINCYRQDKEWSCTTVASLISDDPVGIDANTPKTLTATVEPLPEGDLVPYRKDSYLTFVIELTGIHPASSGTAWTPQIVPGGRATLPLLEYADPVSEGFGGTDVTVSTPSQQRQVNPGETVQFPITLKNQNDDPRTVRLSMLGTNQEWATLSHSGNVKLAPGEFKNITLSISAPEGTPDLEVADIVLEVVDTERPLQRSLLRIVATVDSSQDYPDEGVAEQSTAEESPGVMLWLLIVGLALLAVRRRNSN